MLIHYTLQKTRSVDIGVFDQRGRRVAAIADGIIPAGNHAAVWNAKRAPAAVYVCRVSIDGMEGWAGKIVVGR